MAPVPRRPQVLPSLPLHLRPFSSQNHQQLPLFSFPSFLSCPFSPVHYQKEEPAALPSLPELPQLIEEPAHSVQDSCPFSLGVRLCVRFWGHFPNQTRLVQKEEIWKWPIREREGETVRGQSSGLMLGVRSVVEARGWTGRLSDAVRTRWMIRTIDEWSAPYNATSAAVK